MKPRVYLYQHQVIDAVNDGDAACYEGIAFGHDEHTVFQAFLDKTVLLPSGFPVRFQLIVARPSEFEQVADTSVGSKSQALTAQVAVTVFVSKDGNNSLRSTAFVRNGDSVQEAEVYFIPAEAELYSRSKGLLETGALQSRKVTLIGLGSVGSAIAVELAKSGIGRFCLVDFDRLELGNIMRHVCGLNDLGRLKTLCVRDQILQKNPYADVELFQEDINGASDACLADVADSDLLICSTDTDRSRFNVNNLALRFGICTIFGRVITRAAGGDVLRVRPGHGPCFNCLFTQNIRNTNIVDEELSQRRQVEAIMPQYANDEDIDAVIQVGLSTDIAPISNMMVKLALVELSRGLDSGISSLEKDFESDFYIWANRRERVYSEYQPMGARFNKPSILRWYGALVKKDPECPVCGLVGTVQTEENPFI